MAADPVSAAGWGDGVSGKGGGRGGMWAAGGSIAPHLSSQQGPKGEWAV